MRPTIFCVNPLLVTVDQNPFPSYHLPLKHENSRDLQESCSYSYRISFEQICGIFVLEFRTDKLADDLITAHKRSCGKVMFLYGCVSVILFWWPLLTMHWEIGHVTYPCYRHLVVITENFFKIVHLIYNLLISYLHHAGSSVISSYISSFCSKFSMAIYENFLCRKIYFEALIINQ